MKKWWKDSWRSLQHNLRRISWNNEEMSEKIPKKNMRRNIWKIGGRNLWMNPGVEKIPKKIPIENLRESMQEYRKYSMNESWEEFP